MNLELHLLAGLGALALGAGVLLHGGHRQRNRLFALLCAAVAWWTLGLAAAENGILPSLPWPQIYLLGSCLAAPVALHFTLVVVGRAGTLRRWGVPAGYGSELVLWLLTWTTVYRQHDQVWGFAVTALSGALLLGAMVLLFQQTRRLPPARTRRSFRILWVGAAAAMLTALSDFLPREVVPLPLIGVAGVLVLLVLISSVLIRHRFLDVNIYLARVAALVAAAGVGVLAVRLSEALWPARTVPLFLVLLGLLAGASAVTVRVRRPGLLASRTGQPISRALVEISRKLADARTTSEIWRLLEEGRRQLPRGMYTFLYLYRPSGRAYRSVLHLHPVETPGQERRLDDLDNTAPLVTLAREERAPLTRRFVSVEAREAAGPRRRLARAALAQMETLDADLVVPLLDEGRLIGMLGAGGGGLDRDLTAEVAAAFQAVGNQAVASLQRAEAMESLRRREALAAVGELAAGLAHEIRNPLAALRGAGQALTPGSAPGASAEMLRVIQEETSRLDRFISEFLDYARPAPPDLRAVDPSALVDGVARAAEAAGWRLKIQVRRPEDLSPVLGDAEQLRRAVENIVRNAWEAAGGGGSLIISLAADREARRVRICFQDDGPGIPPGDLSRIFHPFHSGRPGGTGLGLALVQRVVQAHGGEVSVDAGPGRGATFTLELPMAPGRGA